VIFSGKRQGLECLPKENKTLNEVAGIELVDYRFMRDPEFHSYEDWKDMLT
jgi:hypothetical protein